MKFAVMSLGCRVNMSEIQSVSTSLIEAGHQAAAKNEAELHIINSCGVTEGSERKTRKLLYQSLRSGAKKIILTGCAAGKERKEGNVYYISNDYKYLIPELVDNWELFEDINERKSSRFDFKPAAFSSRARINIKIQDGCSHFCSYCIIPMLRGKPQSKPARSVLEELRQLYEAGYREFLLSGICIGNYFHDGKGLDYLLEQILELPGDFRIHLSSISPLSVTKEIVSMLRHDKMVKHLSLSLQSGSDNILKKMNRHYTAYEYLKIVESIKQQIPLFNFTTDIIVGFPGETEKDFRESLSVVKEADFSHVHTFRFSARPGTAAASMTETVPEAVKTERSRRLIKQTGIQKTGYYKRFDELESVFLNEGVRNGLSHGFNEYYVPVSLEDILPVNRFFRIRTRFVKDENILKGNMLYTV